MENLSFLETGEFFIKDIVWGKDEYGDYWSAPFFDKKTGLQKGMTGTFYDIENNGMRESKEDQESFVTKCTL